MEGKDETGFRKLTRKAVSAVNRDVLVFTFFLFLSFGLWYINSLGKEVEADLRYPVEYINAPDNRIITEEMPVRVILSLKGPGYSMLKLKVLGDRPPLQIDLSKFSYKRIQKGGDSDYYIVTTGLAKSLTVQIRSGCEVTAIRPDTLFFAFSKTVGTPGSALK